MGNCAKAPSSAELPVWKRSSLPLGRVLRPLIPHHPRTHGDDFLQNPTRPVPAMDLETIGVSSCSSSRDFQKQPFSSDEKASVMGLADLPSVHLAARASWGPFSPSRAGKGGAQKGSVSTWGARRQLRRRTLPIRV